MREASDLDLQGVACATMTRDQGDGHADARTAPSTTTVEAPPRLSVRGLASTGRTPPSFKKHVRGPRTWGERCAAAAEKESGAPAAVGRTCPLLPQQWPESLLRPRGWSARVRCCRSSGPRVRSARGGGASVSAASAALAREFAPHAGGGRACPLLPQPWPVILAGRVAEPATAFCRVRVVRCGWLWRGLSSPPTTLTHGPLAPSHVFARHTSQCSAHKPRSTPHLTEPPAAACCRDLHARGLHTH